MRVTRSKKPNTTVSIRVGSLCAENGQCVTFQDDPSRDVLVAPQGVQEPNANRAEPRAVEQWHREQPQQPTTTVPDNQSTKGRRKKVWRYMDNQELMFCYFVADPGQLGYRKRLLEMWRERRIGDLSTEQNLADQCRAILMHQYLSTEELGFLEKLANEKGRTTEVLTFHQAAAAPNVESPMVDEVVDRLMVRVQEAYQQEDLIRTRLPTLKAVPKFKLHNLMKSLNDVVSRIPTDNLTETNRLMYAVAVVASEELGFKVRQVPSAMKTVQQPKWKVRLQRKIDELRRETSQLEQLRKGKLTDRDVKMKLTHKYHLFNRSYAEVSEDLRQRITATSKKITRYEKRVQQFQQNRLFTTDQKKVFQQISGEEVTFNQPSPPKEEATAFWRNLWDQPVEYNTAAEWLPQVESSTKKVQVQGNILITSEKVTKQAAKMKNWKAAGPDQVHSYWIKQLSNLHERLAKQFQLAIERGIPEWMGMGRTVLIMKDKEKGAVVENYRPITCLPTTWKLLTSILSEELYEHLDKNKLMPIEQKGCRKASRGTKDQLLIDKMVLRNCKRRHVNLYTTWIDYKKAYDSVPHSWILKCLDLVKINGTIIQFLKKSMGVWKTQLTINNEVIGDCNIRRGIFQGDSLSPLLFIIAMLPLSKILNNTKKGFKLSQDSGKMNHLLYMDDLKLFASSMKEITELTTTVDKFSQDIGMEFGLNKCAVMEVKKGQMVDSSGIELPDGRKIPGLETEGSYKYLGMLEADSIKKHQMKKKTSQEYLKRVRQVLKSDLNAGNTVHAINVWAVSAFRYSAGILDWTKEELEEIDRKTRKLLTVYRMHHPKADTDRLYLPREVGGRGLTNIWQCVEEDKRSLVDYLTQSEEKLLQQVQKEHLVGTQGNSAQFRKEVRKGRLDSWHEKALHGQYIRDTEGKVNKEDTAGWLRSGRLKKETEGLIVAAQDQVLSTNAIKVKIYKQNGSPMCRLCGVKEETVDHLVSCCEKIAQTDYKGRHDRVATLIHWSLCKQYGFPRSDNWWAHQAEKVLENDDYKVLWDFSIRTDKVIKEHRPDIVIVDKRKREAMLVDVAIPGDARVASKEIEKISKYQDLAVEVQRLWELRKVKVVPIVIGALGAVPLAFQKHLKSLNVTDISVEQLQRTAILGTANILRRYLKV